MTQGVYWLGVAAGATLILVVTEMVRRRYLRGRYAVIWVGLGAAAVTVALFPDLLNVAAAAIGVAVPLNLLLFCSSIATLVLIIQLSVEAGRTQEKTRVLAEEVALLRLELSQLKARAPEQTLGQDTKGDPEASSTPWSRGRGPH